MNKIICVFPEDETTLFLKRVYDLLETYDVICYSFNTNNDEILKNKVKSELEELCEDSCFIFLGHGASHVVYGSPNNDENTSFLTKKEIENLKCKMCLVSCRSSELLDKKRNSIGFGEIPTDYNVDVLRMRENDVSYLKNINETHIEQFKLIFVNIMLSSFKQWFSCESYSIAKLNSFFRLFINKNICDLLLNKKGNNYNYRGIANILYDLKYDLKYTSL